MNGRPSQQFLSVDESGSRNRETPPDEARSKEPGWNFLSVDESGCPTCHSIQQQLHDLLTKHSIPLVKCPHHILHCNDKSTILGWLHQLQEFSPHFSPMPLICSLNQGGVAVEVASASVKVWQMTPRDTIDTTYWIKARNVYSFLFWQELLSLRCANAYFFLFSLSPMPQLFDIVLNQQPSQADIITTVQSTQKCLHTELSYLLVQLATELH